MCIGCYSVEVSSISVGRDSRITQNCNNFIFLSETTPKHSVHEFVVHSTSVSFRLEHSNISF